MEEVETGAQEDEQQREGGGEQEVEASQEVPPPSPPSPPSSPSPPSPPSPPIPQSVPTTHPPDDIESGRGHGAGLRPCRVTEMPSLLRSH